MKKKQLLVLVLAMVCIAAISITATLAYLQSTDAVENTFTVGHVTITLDEADVNPDGTVIEGAVRVEKNEYKLFPGHTYTKDPTVHVAADSEECWLFVTVANGIERIEDAKTIATQMGEKGWEVLEGVTYNGLPVYAFMSTVEGGKDVPVFDSFKILGTVDNATLANYKDAKVTINAYAVQADGFDTAAAAWEAAHAAFNQQ